MLRRSYLITILFFTLCYLELVPGQASIVRAQEAAAMGKDKEQLFKVRKDPMQTWINWDYNCNALDPEGIRDFVREAVAANLQGISIRISNKGVLNYRTNIGERYWERLGAFGKDYDPLRILIEECKAQKMGSAVWFDLYEAAYSPLIKDNPGLTPQGLPGKSNYAGSFSYSEPEVRKHMLALVSELAAYSPDRVFFCTKSSHIPTGTKMVRNRDSGFNPSAIKRYRELYGNNVPLSEFDRKKLSLIHGDFLIDFLVDAKKVLNAAGIESVVGATVSGRLQIGGNIMLDWRKLIARKAANAICMANSRSEYDVFYDSEGQELFREILEECHGAGIKFYPYILSSGTYSTLAEEYGFHALLDYIPRQLQYLHALGGDGLIIHDLDLFSFDPVIRRKLWHTVGNYSKLAEPIGINLPMDVPRIDSTKSSPPEASVFSYTAPGSRMNGGVWNGSFEYQKDNPNEKPDGWETEVPVDGSIIAEYDRKVLHGNATSGRNFDGRSSVMLAVSLGAGHDAHTQTEGSWKTRIYFDEKCSQGEQLLSVKVHGEGLRGIAEVGMKITFYDANNRERHTLNVPAPTEGDFAWRTLQTKCRVDPDSRYAEVSFYLITKNGEEAKGKIWFDNFEMGDGWIQSL